jgi:hypothetical protein
MRATWLGHHILRDLTFLKYVLDTSKSVLRENCVINEKNLTHTHTFIFAPRVALLTRLCLLMAYMKRAVAGCVHFAKTGNNSGLMQRDHVKWLDTGWTTEVRF